MKRTVRARNQELYGALAPRVTDVAAPGRLSKATHVPPSAYSAAVLKVAGSGGDVVDDLAAYFEKNPVLRDAIERAAAAADASQRVAAARAVVERWFEREMDQLSRFYRRQTRKILLIAIPLVLLTHANAIATFSDLRRDASLRQAAVSAAAAVEGADSFCPSGTTTASTVPADPIVAAGGDLTCARDVLDRATAFRVGLAWQELKSASGATGADAEFAPGDVLPYVGGALSDDWGFIGRALTLVALMFGAQFWFDALRRLVGLRKTVRGEGGGAAG